MKMENFSDIYTRHEMKTKKKNKRWNSFFDTYLCVRSSFMWPCCSYCCKICFELCYCCLENQSLAKTHLQFDLYVALSTFQVNGMALPSQSKTT